MDHFQQKQSKPQEQMFVLSIISNNAYVIFGGKQVLVIVGLIEWNLAEAGIKKWKSSDFVTISHYTCIQALRGRLNDMQ